MGQLGPGLKYLSFIYRFVIFSACLMLEAKEMKGGSGYNALMVSVPLSQNEPKLYVMRTSGA